MVIALITAFWSFIPITHPDKLKAKIRSLSNNAYKNLFLYSDIASFDTFERFESEIKEIGFFDNVKYGIIWLGIFNCEGLQKEIDSALESIFKKEKRFNR